GSTMSLASTESKPVPGPRSSAQVASAGPSNNLFGGLFSSSGDASKSSTDSQPGVFDRVSKLLHGSDTAGTDAAAPPTPKARPTAAKPATQTASAPPGAIRPKSPTTSPTTSPSPVQSDVKSATAGAGKSQAPPADAQPQPVETANNTNLLRGAQPPVPAGGFDSRWGAMR
ncbi:MAG TPA: hypothetical protein VG291_09720, partial [Xanthobacteraceae bacterium]|nr:hypothetical protein [Xanthobacteraceae bacterium]